MTPQRVNSSVGSLCVEIPRRRWVLKNKILRMIVMRVLKYWVLQFKFLMREGEWPCGALDSEPAANVPESGIWNKQNLNANDGEWESRCKAQKRSWGIEQGNCCQGDCAVSRRKHLKLFSNGPRVNPLSGKSEPIEKSYFLNICYGLGLKCYSCCECLSDSLLWP